MIFVVNSKCPICGGQFNCVKVTYEHKQVNSVCGWCDKCGVEIRLEEGETPNVIDNWNKMIEPTLDDLKAGEKLMEKIKKGVPLDGRSKL